jgi:hypothetical protein
VSAWAERSPLRSTGFRKIWNVPRSDRNHYDNSGPAKIGVSVTTNGKTRQYILPVQMENLTLNSTMYARLVGSKTYYD